MGQLQKITLDTVEFHPVKVDNNGVAHLRTRGESINDASTISLQARNGRNGGASKVTAKIAIPYWYTAKGDASKKGRETMRVDVTVALPPNASLANRQDVYKKLKAFVESSAVKDAVENLESLF